MLKAARGYTDRAGTHPCPCSRQCRGKLVKRELALRLLEVQVATGASWTRSTTTASTGYAYRHWLSGPRTRTHWWQSKCMNKRFVDPNTPGKGDLPGTAGESPEMRRRAGLCSQCSRMVESQFIDRGHQTAFEAERIGCQSWAV